MLDGFQRLQLPEGGVRGGYGEPWGDSENATSWQMKCILVYAPNQYTSYMFAACAAGSPCVDRDRPRQGR